MSQANADQIGYVSICPTCGVRFGEAILTCPVDKCDLEEIGGDRLLGEKINERYRMTSLLGSGGFGSVYKAKDEMMRRVVAVKILHPRHAMEDMQVKRFYREIEAAAALNHPNITTIYDCGVADNAQPFLVMEYLDGTPLDKVFAVEERLSVKRSVHIVSQVCKALSAAHEKGIVHRDIKPSNIMLSNDDSVKVLDFGLAKEMRSAREILTSAGELYGTLQYMSPEQIKGEELDGRSDIYSLGCVLYEALSGSRFCNTDNTYECLVKHVQEEPRSLPGGVTDLSIPASLEKVVLKTLSKNPADRFQSASELEDALTGSLRDPGSTRFAVRSGRAFVWIFALAVVSVTGIVVWQANSAIKGHESGAGLSQSQSGSKTTSPGQSLGEEPWKGSALVGKEATSTLTSSLSRGSGASAAQSDGQAAHQQANGATRSGGGRETDRSKGSVPKQALAGLEPALPKVSQTDHYRQEAGEYKAEVDILKAKLSSLTSKAPPPTSQEVQRLHARVGHEAAVSTDLHKVALAPAAALNAGFLPSTTSPKVHGGKAGATDPGRGVEAKGVRSFASKLPFPSREHWRRRKDGGIVFTDIADNAVESDNLRVLLGHCRELKFVTDINIEDTSADDAVMTFISQKCPNLQSLGLKHTYVTNKGVARLAGLSSLIRLDLYGTEVTDNGIASITGLSNLEQLNLAATQVTEAVVDSLVQFKKLKIVNLTPVLSQKALAKLKDHRITVE